MYLNIFFFIGIKKFLQNSTKIMIENLQLENQKDILNLKTNIDKSITIEFQFIVEKFAILINFSNNKKINEYVNSYKLPITP